MELVRLEHAVGVATPQGTLQLGPILGVGRNYADHAAEQGHKPPERPMIFTKNPASACLNNDTIFIPTATRGEAEGGPEQVDYEGELAVIVGQSGRDIARDAAVAHVLGYTIANDVSARWWQKQGAGGQFFRGKSFDTFCPIGPRVLTPEEIPDPQSLRLTTRLNADVVQNAPTSDMTLSVIDLIVELSRGTTLTAGTVILTGTPSGVGMAQQPARYLRDGDVVQVTIEPIGTLTNPVQTER